jgi:hypothetical protein
MATFVSSAEKRIPQTCAAMSLWRFVNLERSRSHSLCRPPARERSATVSPIRTAAWTGFMQPNYGRTIRPEAMTAGILVLSANRHGSTPIWFKRKIRIVPICHSG